MYNKNRMCFLGGGGIMRVVNLDVDIDHDVIRDEINKRIDKALHQTLIFWDINEMSKRTCMSKSFLENEFLHKPQMKIIERSKKHGKRFWPVKESVKVIQQIMDEW